MYITLHHAPDAREPLGRVRERRAAVVGAVAAREVVLPAVAEPHDELRESDAVVASSVAKRRRRRRSSEPKVAAGTTAGGGETRRTRSSDEMRRAPIRARERWGGA